ncbi:hypothetical protein ACIQV3_39760 [Streptomyces sp. NPDC099050]|uniref:hypothetical protein n=1 Tax=Streptomyces sp. NPDC099050 TaxID=3366100 RepID=UPI003804AD12
MALDPPPPKPDSQPTHDDTAQAADARTFPEAQRLAGDELLPCGRPLSRAWEQARDAGTTAEPAHTATCPYCRQAVEGLAALDHATQALLQKERPSGHSLADRVISAVRAEVRLGTMLTLDDPAHDLRIAESAAAKVLRQAADTIPGARAASCHLTATGDGTAIHVTMTLAAALDQPLPARAAQVRRAVLHAAQHQLGLAVTSVDLKIDAVLAPADVAGEALSERSGQQ